MDCMCGVCVFILLGYVLCFVRVCCCVLLSYDMCIIMCCDIYVCVCQIFVLGRCMSDCECVNM